MILKITLNFKIEQLSSLIKYSIIKQLRILFLCYFINSELYKLRTKKLSNWTVFLLQGRRANLNAYGDAKGQSPPAKLL